MITKEQPFYEKLIEIHHEHELQLQQNLARFVKSHIMTNQFKQ